MTAICRQAMQEDPSRRYRSAEEFAGDLRRWLRDEPTHARPAWVVRRAWLWARRKPGWAAALVALLVALITLSLSWLKIVETRADAAVARAEAARGDAESKGLVAEAQAQSIRRELLLQQLQQARLSTRRNGWSSEAWKRIEEMAQTGKEGLTNQAAATLIGLDAKCLMHQEFGASSVAFDASGRYLLMGGLSPGMDRRNPSGQGAKVWDQQTDQVLYTSKQLGLGPVAMRADGTPLQLVADPKDRLSLLMWDIKADRLVRQFKLAPTREPQPLTLSNHPRMTMTADGSWLAAAAVLPDGQGILAVWKTDIGENLLQRPTRPVNALALSPDRTLLATGDTEGLITVWSLPGGQEVARLKRDRMAIGCLTFQQDRRRGGSGQSAGAGWLLAAGEVGGTVTVWDCGTRALGTICRGSDAGIHALVFSPDSTILASTGRSEVRLWDGATGRLLLEVKANNWNMDVSFAPDGRRLAYSSRSAFGELGMVEIWELEFGRGIQTLRGLASSVEKVTLSPDDRLAAALARDNRVAVWSRATQELLHVFEAPKVAWTDNAALAFSPDSRQLAFAGSSSEQGQARLWDVTSGEEIRSSSFAPGLENILAFHPSGKLLLFQMETRDGKQLPGEGVDILKNPPVIRVHDLLSDDPRKALFEITEFNGIIGRPVGSIDGKFWALVGRQREKDNVHRRIKVYDGLSGRELWSSLSEIHRWGNEFSISLDRTGRFLMIHRNSERMIQETLVGMPSGKHLGRSEFPGAPTWGWSPALPYWIQGDPPDHLRHIGLVRRGESKPVVVLDFDVPAAGVQHEFNLSGTHYAWGNADGTVYVCDIPAVQQRLTAVGLGW